jgi:ABC-type spermidine/putrescine transport system permease subunit II
MKPCPRNSTRNCRTSFRAVLHVRNVAAAMIGVTIAAGAAAAATVIGAPVAVAVTAAEGAWAGPAWDAPSR